MKQNFTDYSDYEENPGDPNVHSHSDIYELAIVSIMFLVGTPMNLCATVSIIKQFKAVKTRLLWLQLHLCIADLTVLLFFALPQIFWILTLEFRGDDFSCKIVKFLSLFSLYLSSNIVACISIDRSITVGKPLQFNMTSTKSVKGLTLFSWIVAAMCSAPQLYFWRTYVLQFDEISVRHCTNLQKIGEVEKDSSQQLMRLWTGYTCFHLITVFWVPLLIMIISYANILRVVSMRHAFMERDAKQMSLTKLHVAQSSYVAIEVGLKSFAISTEVLPQRQSQIFNQSNLKEALEVSPLPKNNALLHSMRKITHKFANSKAKLMTALIVISYVTCWLPYNLINIWALIDAESDALKLTNIFYHLIILNTIINPCIYYYHYLAKVMKRIKKRRRPTNLVPN